MVIPEASCAAQLRFSLPGQGVWQTQAGHSSSAYSTSSLGTDNGRDTGLCPSNCIEACAKFGEVHGPVPHEDAAGSNGPFFCQYQD